MHVLSNVFLIFLLDTTDLQLETWCCIILTLTAIAGEGLLLRGSSEHIQRITTYHQRTCPSSGIALGALTVPWVAAGLVVKATRDGLSAGKYFSIL